MKQYKNIIFDLDGTLTDSKLGIINSVKYALDYLGLRDYDEKVLVSFVGPPLEESFREHFNLDDKTIVLGIELFREYFKNQGMYENEVYNGVEDMLRSLKDMGYRLFVASSKPEIFVRKILKMFKLDDYFDYMAGATLDDTRYLKADVIAYLLKTMDLANDECLMIGDRRHDIEGARAMSLDCMAVAYGYGTTRELERAGAGYTALTVADIVKILHK